MLLPWLGTVTATLNPISRRVSAWVEQADLVENATSRPPVEDPAVGAKAAVGARTAGRQEERRNQRQERRERRQEFRENVDDRLDHFDDRMDRIEERMKRLEQRR